jgi:hypothetical protein
MMQLGSTRASMHLDPRNHFGTIRAPTPGHQIACVLYQLSGLHLSVEATAGVVHMGAHPSRLWLRNVFTISYIHRL